MVDEVATQYKAAEFTARVAVILERARLTLTTEEVTELEAHIRRTGGSP